MIIVQGEVHFSDGALDRLRPALAKLVEASRAMPGCLHYSQAIDTLDPNMLVVSQRWEDEALMAAYYAAPPLWEFGKQVDDATVRHMSIKSYTAEYLRTMMAKEEA